MSAKFLHKKSLKTLAVDPGLKRVGLAACDEFGLTTRPLSQLAFRGLPELLLELEEIIRAEKFVKVLIGLPLHLDGQKSEAAKRSQKLAERLQHKLKQENLECEVVLWDERLTSFEAEQRLRDRGKSKAKAKGELDSLAAQVLLEDYLRDQVLEL